ncbi:MAG: hypothetical protein HOQ47_01375 [Streptomyces sp.]|nr:hypothetical protein [Streptomyces sp.]
MRRATYALACLYAILAVGLLRCAMVSYQAHSPGYTAFFAAAAIGAALAIVHTSWLMDEYRAALVAVDRGSLPGQLKTRQDITVERELAAACCEQWWTSAGAEHTCTRKDQTL